MMTTTQPKPKPMKKHILFICVAALLCVPKIHARRASAEEANCASMSLIYTSPSWSDVKDGRGLGAAMGITFFGVAFMEVEAMYLRHGMKDLSGSLTQVPVLGTFAVRFPFEKARVGLQIGGSVGPAMQQWKIMDRSSTNIVAAVAGQALIAWYPSPTHWRGSINAGAKELWTSKNAGRKAGATRCFPSGPTSFSKQRLPGIASVIFARDLL